MSLIPPEFVGPFPGGIKPVRNGVYPTSGTYRNWVTPWTSPLWGLSHVDFIKACFDEYRTEEIRQTKSWYGLTQEAYERALVDPAYFEALLKKARELP